MPGLERGIPALLRPDLITALLPQETALLHIAVRPLKKSDVQRVQMLDMQSIAAILAP